MTARADIPILPGLRRELDAPDVAAAARLAAVLGDPVRAGILALLGGGPHNVCEMAAALDERQNNISNHLRQLRRAGLVQASRHMVDARWVYYERDDATCAAALEAIDGLLGRRSRIKR